jgi:hypothetical protein
MQLAANAAGITVMFLTAAMLAWYKMVDRMPPLRTVAAPGRPSDGIAK